LLERGEKKKKKRGVKYTAGLFPKFLLPAEKKSDEKRREGKREGKKKKREISGNVRPDRARWWGTKGKRGEKEKRRGKRNENARRGSGYSAVQAEEKGREKKKGGRKKERRERKIRRLGFVFPRCPYYFLRAPRTKEERGKKKKGRREREKRRR